MAKSRYIDAVLRFRDEMTGKMDVAIKKMTDSQKRFNTAGNNMVKTGKKITNAGSTLTKGLTTPILAIGTASVKTAAEFEAGMSNVQAIAGASADEMEQLRDKAIEMGAKTKFSAKESADAFSYMATAGWDTADMLDGIEGIMYLAGATGEDLAQTSDIVTDALTAFGLEASDTNRFVDVLAQTANATNTDVSKMGETFTYVAPVAGALGYSIEDTSVAIGLMANQGIKASQAGTALRSLLTNLSKPTKQMKGAMEDLGISLTDSEGNMKSLNEIMSDLRGSFAGLSEAEKANYAATIAGKTGMSGLLAIVNSTDEDFDSVTKSINNCTGAAKEMYDVATDNLAGRLTTLKATIESIAISIGDRLSPYIEKAMEFIQGLADKFNSLSDEQLEVIIKIAGVVAAIGPVLLVVGKATTSIGKLLKSGKSIVKGIKTVRNAFDSVTGVIGILNPKFLLLIGIVALVATVAFLIYKNWDKIKPLFEKVGEAFKKLGEGFKDIGERIKSDWNDIKQWWEDSCGKFKEKCGAAKEAWNKLKDGFKAIGELIKSDWNNLKESWQGFCDKIENKCDDIKNKWEDFKDKAITVFRMIKDAIKAWADGVRDKFNEFKGHIELIKSYIESFVISVVDKFNEFKDAAIEKINAIKDKFTEWKEHCKEQFDSFKEKVIEVYEGIKDFVGNAIDKVEEFKKGIEEKFDNVKEKIKSWYENVKAKFESFKNAINAVVNKVKDFAEKVIGKFNTVKTTIGNIISSIKSKIDTIKATLNGVINFVKNTFTTAWRSAWHGVKKIFTGIFANLSSALKAPLNAVIGLINGAIGKINSISFTVPDWVPGLGGKTFGASLRTIPYLYKGTNYFEGGTAVIHDRGAEIVDLPRGTRVIPHDKSLNEAYKMGVSSKHGGSSTKSITIAKLADTIVVREEADIDKIAEKLAKKLEETDNDYNDVA